jgi:3-hydroxyacyl-CoA dehydrogenase
MEGAGQKPFALSHEIEGFVMNRLQGALLDEAMLLVEQGYVSVEDIDTAMRDGLARRWVFMGPFETIDLNAPDGIGDFLDRYGPAYSEIGRHRPNRLAWEGTLAETVVAARRALLPAERLAERQAWRDSRLARLAALLRTAEH